MDKPAMLVSGLGCAHLSLYALHGANTGPAQSRRLDDSSTRGEFGTDCLDLALGQGLLANRFSAFGAELARTCETSLDTLLDDRALEFREDAEHLEESAPGRSCRVDGLPLEVEIAPDCV